MTTNEKEGICYAQPKNMSERIGIAKDFVQRFRFQIPTFVDTMENTADDLYAAWPERIYVINDQNRIVYKSKLGPAGFDLTELEHWLLRYVPDDTKPTDQLGKPRQVFK